MRLRQEVNNLTSGMTVEATAIKTGSASLLSTSTL